MNVKTTFWGVKQHEITFDRSDIVRMVDMYLEKYPHTGLGKIDLSRSYDKDIDLDEDKCELSVTVRYRKNTEEEK